MLTQLDVINQCLASMALAPITEGEIAGNPYAQVAQAKLTQTTIDTLSKGWWFNERLITGLLPADLLRVEGNFGRTLSWRGATAGIYDHTRGMYLTAPYPAKTLGYVALPFPDLPPPLQGYIAALTVVAFQAEFDGSDTKYKQLAGEVARSLAVLQEVDRNSRVNFKRLWELLAYGWWFNSTEFTAFPGAPAVLPAGTLAVQGPPTQPLFLEPNLGAICHTWTGSQITASVERARAIIQVPPEALPAAAAEWLRKASALDAERESLSPDPRMLAELNQQLDNSWAALRRENGERVILREQSRDFQARGWWFNTHPLEDCVVEVTPEAPTPQPGNIGVLRVPPELLAGNDPHWDNVVFLAHWDGTVGTQDYVDSSQYAHPLTAVGVSELSATTPLFGPTLYRSDSGTVSGVTTPKTIEVGDGDDWTLESAAWLNNYNPSGSHILQFGRDWDNRVNIAVNSAGKLSGFICRANYDTQKFAITADLPFPLNSLVRVSFSKQGNSYVLAMNGTVVAEGTSTFCPLPGLWGVDAGMERYRTDFDYHWRGRLDESRVTVRVGRYSEDYALPGGPFSEALPAEPYPAAGEPGHLSVLVDFANQVVEPIVDASTFPFSQPALNDPALYTLLTTAAIEDANTVTIGFGATTVGNVLPVVALLPVGDDVLAPAGRDAVEIHLPAAGGDFCTVLSCSFGVPVGTVYPAGSALLNVGPRTRLGARLRLTWPAWDLAISPPLVTVTREEDYLGEVAPPAPVPVTTVIPDAVRARGPGCQPVSLRTVENGWLGLWDHRANALVDLEGELPAGVTIWRELPFEELPPKAQEYVRVISRIAYSREQGASPSYMAQLRGEEARLLRELQHEQTSTLRNNVANRAALQRKLLDIRTGGLYYRSRVPIR